MTWSAEFVSNAECADVTGPAVVIDVLRAYSFAACALSVGAERILLVAELDVALELKATIPGALACKDGGPAEGFEFLNSPAVALTQDLTGQAIVQRTSAGTQGAVAARRAAPLFCASFLTARATAEAIRSCIPSQPVTFVITGDGGTAQEDIACAEYIAALLDGPDIAPDRFVAQAAASKTASALRKAGRIGYPGVDADDVGICLQADRFPFAMVAQDDTVAITLRVHTEAT